MSRFFRKNVGELSSESESDYSESESDISSVSSYSDEEGGDFSESSGEQSGGEEEEVVESKPEEEAKKKNLSRFLRTDAESDDSDEDDDGNGSRPVKSQLAKRTDEVASLVDQIQESLMGDDWFHVEKDFDALLKLLTKNAAVFARSGYPEVFCELLEDLLAEVGSSDKEEEDKKRKKMDAVNTKAWNAMRQKLRKAEKTFEDTLVWHRKKLTGGNERDEEGEGSDVKKDHVSRFDESVLRRLNEIMSVRGKKNTDKSDQVKSLRELLAISQVPAHKAKVLMALISSQFDYSISSFMDLATWKQVENDVNLLCEILEQNSEFKVQEEDGPEIIDISSNVKASCVSFISRLDDEFTKSLLNTDPHSAEYIDRLKEESALFNLIVRLQRFFEKSQDKEHMCVLLERKLDHLSFKPDASVKMFALQEEKSRSEREKSSQEEVEIIPSIIIQNICRFLYKNGNDRTRTRSLLHHIYNHSLHDRFYEARDLLLISHIQESIVNADISTQILYNRSIVQLGFCAFRLGLLKEAHSCLLEIVTSGHYKELLAQGSRDEKTERIRYVPFHMHINLDLVESVFLVCSLLLEVPNMVYNQLEFKRKFVSKSLKRLLENHERNLFSGVVESSRDKIIAGAKYLSAGDHRKSIECIVNVKVWELMGATACEKIRNMITKKIKEESLRCFLYSLHQVYDSISVATLMQQFDLSKGDVMRMLNRLFVNDELRGSVQMTAKGGEIVRIQAKNELWRFNMLQSVVIDKIAMMTEK